MTPAEVETLILEQARAYQTATEQCGRGKAERTTVVAIRPDVDFLVSGGGYATKAVLSHYVPVITLAGGGLTSTRAPRWTGVLLLPGAFENGRRR